MKLIAAVDKNWGIGNKNSLLVRIPSDLKRFRDITLDKVVVLGRKTLETFPKKRPLDNRTNIILSKNKNYKVKDAIVVSDKLKLLKELSKYDTDDIFILGGQSIYNLMIDECDIAYITYLNYEYEADSYMPNLDKSNDWILEQKSEEQTFFDVIFEFRKYVRK